MTPEEIAKKFMGQLTVYAPSKADPIDEQHWQEAETWLTQAIKQQNQQLTEALIKAVDALRFYAEFEHYRKGNSTLLIGPFMDSSRPGNSFYKTDRGDIAREALAKIELTYKHLEEK